MSRFKFAVNTNALSKKMSVPEIAGLCKKTGLDGIEWGLPAIDLIPGVIFDMQKAAIDNGLEILGYINATHLWKTDNMKRYSELVSKAGGKSLRVMPPWLSFSYEETIRQKLSCMEYRKLCREGVEKLVPLSKEFGIKYVLEMHMGNVCPSADSAVKILDGIDPNCVGIIYDPANGAEEGFTRPVYALEVLGRYHAYTHAKNLLKLYSGHKVNNGVQRAVWEFKFCSLEDGIVDYMEVIYALKRIGYHGWISFEEFFGAAPEIEISRALAFLKHCEQAVPDVPQEPYLTFND